MAAAGGVPLRHSCLTCSASGERELGGCTRHTLRPVRAPQQAGHVPDLAVLAQRGGQRGARAAPVARARHRRQRALPCGRARPGSGRPSRHTHASPPGTSCYTRNPMGMQAHATSRAAAPRGRAASPRTCLRSCAAGRRGVRPCTAPGRASGPARAGHPGPHPGRSRCRRRGTPAPSRPRAGCPARRPCPWRSSLPRARARGLVSPACAGRRASAARSKTRRAGPARAPVPATSTQPGRPSA